MSAKTATVPDRKITRDDIEAKLRELQGEIGERTEAAKVPAIAIAVGVAVVTIAAAYLLGRRKGKRRQTVLEIRRI
jgi:predicted xylose isomerase-like sugar epimerase